MEGDIIVQRNAIDDNSVISDSSSTSSGSRQHSYRSRTRKEKQNKHHGPKGIMFKWWDRNSEESISPAHPLTRSSCIQTDPVNK